jgi:transcriptional regulator with XRE-family HTH domain
MDIQKRLKEERLRLDFSQVDVADMCGVSKQSIHAWENKSQIPMDRLVTLASRGFDVQYIMTGVHSTNLNQVAEQKAKDEEWLEIKVSRLSETQRDVVKTMVSEIVQEMERANDREQKAREQALRAVNGKK